MELEQKLAQLRQALRPGQRELADWQGGRLAVSAVPGAGKSTGMATAAAIAIARHRLHRRRQLVIVTFTRSAALNIRTKVIKHLRFLGLPQSAFLANTLHGLAFGIAAAHPDLSGISSQEIQLITDTQKAKFARRAIATWQDQHPQDYQLLVEGRGFDGEDTERLRRQNVLRTEVLPNFAQEAIAAIKTSGIPLEQIKTMVAGKHQFLQYALEIFSTYTEILAQEQKIDYDDMILAGLRVLADPSARRYWQQRIFAVFEDEAQDSSPLQTKLLETLAHNPEDGTTNLVRVGDPNQAINSTFTAADPRFFNQFCDRARAESRLVTMSYAGRSAAPIIQAANLMLNWANQVYGKLELPFRPQAIAPVLPGDPQLNPAPLGRGLEICYPPEIEDTVKLIAQRATELAEASDLPLSMAILVRNRKQGLFLFENLQKLISSQIDLYDVEQSDRCTQVPADMLAILQFVHRPHSPELVKQALVILSDRQVITKFDFDQYAAKPEQFLFPTPLEPELPPAAKLAQAKCIGLLQAKQELPLYYLISFIAFTLKYDQGELATADKLSDSLNRQLGGKLSLPGLIAALQEIVEAENFMAVATENPEGRYTRAGQLTIITMHKSKGLDWDVVFIPFLHKKVCPGSTFVPEAVKFLADFNLPDVLRLQFTNLFSQSADFEPEIVWQQSQILKQFEELRLLYVGITRAKRLLWMSAAKRLPYSWNNLSQRLDRAEPSPILPELCQRLPASWVKLDANLPVIL
ncbi:MAG: ATP-dependent helicase [Pseudanabaenaceae cyanobacterium bins.68]|nr:ATP-dependent helicase [Pseudanabaenaceae cyanobacterium bins.68]